MYLSANEISSADDIIGKTLYGNTAVPVKRLALDSAPVAWTVPAGAAVGIVYSYLMPRPPERQGLYWMFYDPTGSPYYAEHQPGRFSFEALHAQGVKTTEEKLQAEIEKNKPLEDKLIDAGKWIAVAAIGAFAVVQLLPKLLSKSQSST